jgi:hypothetical protein
VIGAVVPFLNVENAQITIELARSINEDVPRGCALADLAVRLTELKEFREAMTVARQIDWFSRPDEALVRAAANLPASTVEFYINMKKVTAPIMAGIAIGKAKAGDIDRSLEIAVDLKHDERLTALKGIAHYIPPVREQRLAELVIDAVRGDLPREQADKLAKFLPHAPPATRQIIVKQAVASACQMHEHPVTGFQRFFGQRDSDSVDLLTKLQPYVLELPAKESYELWRKEIHILANRDRTAFLDDANPLLGLLATLGGSEGIPDAFAALSDVGKWWP